MNGIVPVAQPSDEALAARAAAGDDSAFETIVARYPGAGVPPGLPADERHRCAAFVESYRATSRILREAVVAAAAPDVEASLKAFLRARTGTFKSS